MSRNMLTKVFEKLKIWFKTKNQLEKQIKDLNQRLNKECKLVEKLKDKLDKDIQNKIIERLTLSEEHSKNQKHILQNENKNLRIENVELRSQLRNLKAERKVI